LLHGRDGSGYRIVEKTFTTAFATFDGMLLAAAAVSVFVTDAALSLLCELASAAEIFEAWQMTANKNKYKAETRCADFMARFSKSISEPSLAVGYHLCRVIMSCDAGWRRCALYAQCV